MPLARIITRSNPCSRELALDLLSRGYAVEIVSPDSVPDNLADLELRVEEDPGNQLVASVEAHNGEHTASLEFLHYLKAPMPDFVRRPPPEAHEAVHSPEPPVSFNAEQSAEEMKLPADAPQLAPTAVSQTAKILDDSRLDPELDPKADSVEGARLTLPPDPLPSLPVDPPSYVAAEVSTMARPMLAKRTIAKQMLAKRTIAKQMLAKQMLAKLTIAKRTIAKLIIAKQTIAKQTIAKQVIAQLAMARPAVARTAREWEWPDIPAGWSSWRIALTVVGAVLLALVLGFGMRRTGKASGAQNSATASTDVNLLSATSPKKDAEKNPVLPPAVKSGGNSDPVPKESQVAKAGPATAAAATVGNGASVPLRHGDDLIARDTVTYFHQRTLPEAASRAGTSQRFAVQHRSSRKQDDVIAANTITPNEKPAPKAAKPDSGVKHYSDLK